MTCKNPNATRCAIYTRKSSEEGLEQEFNSLDAQREACEAYVQSQKHEGWTALPAFYDDGGFSGGNMKRPALERLVSDIKSRKIDIIIVYKIDRLTRSLADFAKMVEMFDKHGVSFVSVTQQFNTKTSMGRLTLNVLLSFAQFEREVTSERIRDKIAASKKKGMWMGGTVPFGYDLQDHKLVVNTGEAETIRHIFRRYLEIGSVRTLKEQLDIDGVTSKRRTSLSGKQSGGKSMSRGALYSLLQNRLYIGEITHKGESYPGRHDAIVDRQLWEQIQTKIAENRVKQTSGARSSEPSLLAGLMFDMEGQRMSPTHANKNGRRYRYYISQKLAGQNRKANPNGLRLPAEGIERLISNRLMDFMSSGSDVVDAINLRDSGALEIRQIIREAANLAKDWPDKPSSQKRSIYLALIQRIDIKKGRIKIHLSTSRLHKLLLDGLENCPAAKKSPANGETLTLTVDFDLKRSYSGAHLLIDSQDANGGPVPDAKLIRLVARGHLLMQKYMNAGWMSINDLAKAEGLSRPYVSSLLRLAFLSPEITTAILNGAQPRGLTSTTIMQEADFPCEWQAQLERAKRM